MKAWKRVLLKIVIFLTVILISGGTAAFLQANRQSSTEYTLKNYLSLLLDDSAEKAYEMLDQSENIYMTAEKYKETLELKKYGTYSSFEVSAGEKRRDSSGQEYVSANVSFLDASGEKKTEETFTVKKQSDPVFGIFDHWKVLSDHCMVKDFILEVPAGAEVYLDAEKADDSWIEENEAASSVDVYRIPELLPGKISLAVRHPVLESVNTTLDSLSGSGDYTEGMSWKESAESEALELGIRFLQAVYASAAAGEKTDPDDVLSTCEKAAEKLIEEQEARFYSDDAEFETAAVSDFGVQYQEPEFETDENGAIRMELTMSYRYLIKETVTVDTEEYLEDGTPIQGTESAEHSGTNTAKLALDYYDSKWHITSFEMNVIPE